MYSRAFTYIHQRKWYARLIPDYKGDGICLLKDHPEETLETKIVVGMETLKPDYHTKQLKHSRIFAVFNTYIDLYRYQALFKEKEKFFYELILGSHPQKPHFDVDVKLTESTPLGTGENVKNDLIRSVLEVMKENGVDLDLERDVLLYTSHGKEKHSYHLIIHHYCHAGHDQARAFYMKVIDKMDPVNAEYVDSGVYSSKQNFRLYGSQKIGSGRPKAFCNPFTVGEKEIIHRFDVEKFESDDPKREKMLKEAERLKESLVSWVRACQYLPSFQSVESQRKKYDYEELGDLSDVILQEAFKFLKRDDFPFVVREVSGHIISLRRLRPSFCEICKRVHEHENPYFLIVGEHIYFCCRRSSTKLLFGTLESTLVSTATLLEPENVEEETTTLRLGGYVPTPREPVSPSERPPQTIKTPPEDALALLCGFEGESTDKREILLCNLLLEEGVSMEEWDEHKDSDRCQKCKKVTEQYNRLGFV